MCYEIPTCETCGAPIGTLEDSETKALLDSGEPILCGACYVAEALSAQQRMALEATATQGAAS